MPTTHKTAHGTVEAAEEGLSFTVSDGEIGGVPVEHSWTVGPKCETNNGSWFCTTHKLAFRNNFEKDSHIGRGHHVLTWVCLEHGPEVP